jgi:hypothetical protein
MRRVKTSTVKSFFDALCHFWSPFGAFLISLNFQFHSSTRSLYYLVAGQVNGLEPWTSIGWFTFVHIDRNIVTTKLGQVNGLEPWTSIGEFTFIVHIIDRNIVTTKLVIKINE